MSFEIVIRKDEEDRDIELIQETKTVSHKTVKLWSQSQIETEIADLTSQITELEERKALLEGQVDKFTEEIPKE